MSDFNRTPHVLICVLLIVVAISPFMVMMIPEAKASNASITISGNLPERTPIPAGATFTPSENTSTNTESDVPSNRKISEFSMPGMICSVSSPKENGLRSTVVYCKSEQIECLVMTSNDANKQTQISCATSSISIRP